MASRRVTLRPAGAPVEVLQAAFAAIRTEFDVPGEFPPEVVEAAQHAADTLVLPSRDETAVPFFTIDPVGSMDLDQAMALARDGAGYHVRYAIADVPAFVAPGGPVDAEARRRGQTIYLPDGRAPLHPPVLSENLASLLPGQTRPAYVWDLRLDADGRVTAAEVYRAVVRSVARLDYDGVQADIDAGRASEDLLLLREIGQKRITLEHERGGASLPKPEQEIVSGPDGYELRYRPLLPSEDWNAQISLMTGMAAADLMLRGGVGLLRTMPPPPPDIVSRFRRQARVLGVDWPEDMRYGDFLRTLDRTNPHHLALIQLAVTLFRGAGYTAFDGAPPAQREHAAVAAPYAHVTAPLRRLVDRFGLVVSAAISAGEEVPGWAREALPTLPDIMRESDRKASAVDRACLDAAEAAVLTPHVGETFEATVVDDRGKGGLRIQIAEPAIEATCDGSAPVGAVVAARLVEADVAARRVRFSL